MRGKLKPLPLGVDKTARSAGEGRDVKPLPLGEGAAPAAATAPGAPVCYVVVCRGPNCRERGSLALRKRLVELLRRDSRARLVGYNCFGQCDFGPNVALYPEGSWYGGLNAPEDAERVARHALGVQTLDQAPLTLPDPERAEHVQNIAELVRTLERDRARGRRWWWPF